MAARASLSLLLLVPLAACGSEPGTSADDTGADAVADASSDAAGDAAGDAATDVPLADTGADVPLDTTADAEACPQPAGFECVQSCNTDVSFPPVCEGGAWTCPDSAPINLEECGPICAGFPETCCDAAGVPVEAQMCVQGLWVCDIGSVGDCTGTSEIAGRWRQVAWLPCPNDVVGEVPDSMIGDMNFDRTTFDLTWDVNLFESYRDYWGTFTWDETTRFLSMEITGGNNVPTTFDLQGTVTIIDGDLYLREHWFGTLDDDPAYAPPTLCGVQLTRW